MRIHLFFLTIISLIFGFLVCLPNIKVSAQQAPNNPLDNPPAGITIIGDSLTEGASSYLKTALPNAIIDPKVSRPWDEGLAILQELSSKGNLAPIVVFALGTNGAATDERVDQVMKLAGNSKVVFMTIYGTTPAAKENSDAHNQAINKAPARYPGKVVIADWSGTASSHPEWFAGDPLGVHPSVEGYQAFAEIVVKATGSTPAAASTGAGGGSVQSNVFCTKVGNPTAEKPAVCTGGAGGPRVVAPEAEGDIRGAILEKFGVSMNGFDRQRLQWAWEKLWDVSNTNFVELVRGSVVEVTSTSNSHQIGCPGAPVAVYLGPFNDENTFKQAFIHEFGHVIANCHTKQRGNWNGYLKAHTAEGGVSYYGGHAESCTGSDSISEDFAEMIAFYLNPGYAVSIVRCNQVPEEVNMASQFPLHFQVAQEILGVY